MLLPSFNNKGKIALPIIFLSSSTLRSTRSSAFVPGTTWQLNRIPVATSRRNQNIEYRSFTTLSRKRNGVSDSQIRVVTDTVSDLTLPIFSDDTSLVSSILEPQSSDAVFDATTGQQEKGAISGQDGMQESIVTGPIIDDKTHTLYEFLENDEVTTIIIDKEEELISISKTKSSTREMLSFAIPALGIFLASPLLSNIDNAFVGKINGAAGLAALSPATICTDQALYLFSCLSGATTNAVSRVTGNRSDDSSETDTKKDIRKAASAPLGAAILTGVLLTTVYALFTPHLLSLLKVPSELHAAASSYIYWRGSASAPALAQSVALSILLATRDVVTPLLIVAVGVVVNIVGDAGLCLWPFRLGCGGAAAASALSAFVSCGLMAKVLQKRDLLPEIRIPKKEEFKGLIQYCTPLFAITMMRFLAFSAAQFRAVALGTTVSAAYQISVNTVLFFLLFGEPLSQLSQTTLPPLIDKRDKTGLRSAISSILRLSSVAALAVGGVAFTTCFHGAGLFATDPAVIALVKESAPSVLALIATGVLYYSIDGAAFASRDFGFVSTVAILTSIMQLCLLPFCTTIPSIFATFTLRFGLFSLAAVLRSLFGKGTLGRIIGGWNIGQRHGWRIRRNQATPPLYSGISGM